MPVNLVALLFRIGVAALVFICVVYWPIPQILAHFLIVVPEFVLWIVGFLLALATFLRGPYWVKGTL